MSTSVDGYTLIYAPTTTGIPRVELPDSLKKEQLFSGKILQQYFEVLPKTPQFSDCRENAAVQCLADIHEIRNLNGQWVSDKKPVPYGTYLVVQLGVSSSVVNVSPNGQVEESFYSLLDRLTRETDPQKKRMYQTALCQLYAKALSK